VNRRLQSIFRAETIKRPPYARPGDIQLRIVVLRSRGFDPSWPAWAGEEIIRGRDQRPAAGRLGGLDRRSGGCGLLQRALGKWRATADEDVHYCFAVAL